MKLATLDNQTIDVDDEIVKMFGVLRTMIEDLPGDRNIEGNGIPVQVDAKVLRQVITWCEHHKNDHLAPANETSDTESSDDENEAEIDNDREQYKRDKRCNLALDPWDEQFLKELDPNDQDAVFPLILAANYLDIPKLLDISCTYIASILRDRTPQWIRKRFNLKCDFTEEQKAKIREELSWYDDNLKISDDEEEPQHTSANGVKGSSPPVPQVEPIQESENRENAVQQE